MCENFSQPNLDPTPREPPLITTFHRKNDPLKHKYQQFDRIQWFWNPTIATYLRRYFHNCLERLIQHTEGTYLLSVKVRLTFSLSKMCKMFFLLNPKIKTVGRIQNQIQCTGGIWSQYSTDPSICSWTHGTNLLSDNLFYALWNRSEYFWELFSEKIKTVVYTVKQRNIFWETT